MLAAQLDARPSVPPPTPIPPEQGCGTDDEGMQEHTYLARFGGRDAIPLTMFPQGTRTTAANARRIDHAQASIGLSTPLLDTKLLARWTVKRAIRLESKVLPRETACFPGQSDFCRSVSLDRRSLRLELPWNRRCKGRSKLRRAHGIRMKLMAQLQAEVPDPLADQLPCFLSHGCMTDPPVGVLLLVFISQRCFKSPTMQIQLNDIGGGECLLG